MRTAFLVVLLLISGSSRAGSLELEGRLEQGALVIGKTEPGARVFHDGEAVPVSPEGDFVIGFEREAPPVSRLEAELPDGRRLVRELEVKRRDYRIQRIDGLPPAKVTPKKEADLKRIRADIAAVKKARALVDQRTDYLDGFQWPARGRISGVYGSQRVLNGKPKRPHYGVDIAGPVGKPVRAPADGIVTLAHPDMFYSGGTLIMDHGQGLSSTFLPCAASGWTPRRWYRPWTSTRQRNPNEKNPASFPVGGLFPVPLRGRPPGGVPDRAGTGPGAARSRCQAGIPA